MYDQSILSTLALFRSATTQRVYVHGSPQTSLDSVGSVSTSLLLSSSGDALLETSS